MDKRIRFFIIFCFVLVLIRVFVFFYSKPVYKYGVHISFISTVSSQPKIYNTNQSFSVNLETGESVFIRTNLDLEFNYSDKVKVSGSLKYLLLKSNRQILTMDNPKISLEDNSQNIILAVVNSIRQKT